jgi:G3E family GTPase
MMKQTMKLPVSIVTGCLGSGKTTLLRAVLQEGSMEHTAVLVNEYGKVGLDHHLLKQAVENTRLLGGGCLCCTVREDLVKNLKDLLDMDQHGKISELERVIIETSGLADPAPILFTILTDPVLQHHFYIEGVIVTVDAVNGHFHLDHQPESIKQVVSADKIIVTKTDLVTSDDVQQLVARLRSINPSAQIAESVYGDVDVDSIFTFEETSHHQLHIEEDKQKYAGSVHEPSTRSISLTFSEPLDWTGFGLWLSMLLHARGQDVLRVKGFIDVGDTGPVMLNGVQHIIHPPEHLESWPNQEHRSHVIFIVRLMDPRQIFHSLLSFQHFLGVRADFLES